MGALDSVWLYLYWSVDILIRVLWLLFGGEFLDGVMGS